MYHISVEGGCHAVAQCWLQYLLRGAADSEEDAFTSGGEVVGAVETVRTCHSTQW